MNTYIVPSKTMPILNSTGKMWDNLIKWKSELDAVNIPSESLILFADEVLFSRLTQSLLDGGISMMEASENILSDKNLDFIGIKLWKNDSLVNNTILMKLYIYEAASLKEQSPTFEPSKKTLPGKYIDCGYIRKATDDIIELKDKNLLHKEEIIKILIGLMSNKDASWDM